MIVVDRDGFWDGLLLGVDWEEGRLEESMMR
jgi:hypothetical protein